MSWVGCQLKTRSRKTRGMASQRFQVRARRTRSYGSYKTSHNAPSVEPSGARKVHESLGRERDKTCGDNERERLANASWTATPRERECQTKDSKRGEHKRETKERRRKEERKDPLIDTMVVVGCPRRV